MRHRLYYLLPDIESARAVHNELLLNRVEEKRIRFMTEGGTLPPDLPEANVLYKSDVVHGAESGMLVGAALGLILGAILVMFVFPEMQAKAAIVLIAAGFGIVFGGWVSSMIGIALPNSRLKSFYPEIEKGKILLILDVPASRIEEIEQLLASRHPEMRFGGEDAHVPVFP